MTKGYFVDNKGRVFIIDNQEIVVKGSVDEMVAKANKKIEDYHEEFARQLGTDEFRISDWFVFQEGLLPLVRENAKLVHDLH